jgi:hypothetical protein
VQYREIGTFPYSAGKILYEENNHSLNLKCELTTSPCFSDPIDHSNIRIPKGPKTKRRQNAFLDCRTFQCLSAQTALKKLPSDDSSIEDFQEYGSRSDQSFVGSVFWDSPSVSLSVSSLDKLFGGECQTQGNPEIGIGET